jgi:H+/Cl- antiporter ClcA
MKRINNLLFLLVLVLGGQDIQVSSSFHLPGKKIQTNYCRRQQQRRRPSCRIDDVKRETKCSTCAVATASRSTAMKVSSGGGVVDEVDAGVDEVDKVYRRHADGRGIKVSIVVGVITAAMGYLYGKVLSFSVTTLWHTLPSMLHMENLNPIYFITGICTIGGLLMGILSSALSSSTFTVADFVSLFSSSGPKSLPSSRVHLLPLLLLSLVTSTFGFSVGPEAPMVCAGALIGASIARYWYGENVDNENHQETLAYAGAAGALTAFMGIPIAGSIFALELTSSHAGLNKAGGKRALSSTIISSIAALITIRAVFEPYSAIGGHFDYGKVIDLLSGRTMIVTSVACGAGGALLGTVFHKLVAIIKKIAWNTKIPPIINNGNGAKSDSIDRKKNNSWIRPVFIKTLIGLLVGIISSNYPQTLFWGEGSLQTMISGQQIAFIDTKHGLSHLLTSSALVNPSLPFETAAAAAQVGLAKLFAIALACAGKFPGGECMHADETEILYKST